MGEIVLYSDSRAAVMAINSTTIKSEMVARTVAALNTLSEDNRVIIRWVKAHCGHKGNEEVDLIAKKGAIENKYRSNDIPHRSGNVIRNEVRNLVIERWNKEWNDKSPCRQTKHFFPTVDKQQSKLYVNNSRKAFS